MAKYATQKKQNKKDVAQQTGTNEMIVAELKPFFFHYFACESWVTAIYRES